MSKIRLTLLLLTLSLSCSVALQAQRTLILPLNFTFYDATKAKTLTFNTPQFGKQTIMRPEVDSLLTKAYSEGLERTFAETLGSAGKDYVMLDLDDLSAKTRKELSDIYYKIHYASKTTVFLINRKEVEDELGSTVAPVFNKLADKYDVDQVLYINVDATNERDNYKEKNKPPSGRVIATAKLFDANDALVTKEKTSAKGDGQNRLSKFTLTPESVSEVLIAAIKKVVK